MTEEFRFIFRPIGIDVVWMKAPDTGRGASPINYTLVLMPIESKRWNLPCHVMGVVAGEKSERCFIYIFFPNVLRALGKKSIASCTPSAREIHELGRALGRVVAHELVHTIAPESPHTNAGLMCAWLKRYSLPHPRLLMSGATAEEVISGLAVTVAARTAAAREK